jgi:hypothetical protein
LGLVVCALGPSCSSSDSGGSGSGEGGSRTSDAGTVGAGGSSGAGLESGAGGSTGRGGTNGAGGVSADSGVSGGGGDVTVSGSGGSSATGAGGSVILTGSGGNGSGGSTGLGGSTGFGGSLARGGSTGSGGFTGLGGAAGRVGAAGAAGSVPSGAAGGLGSGGNSGAAGASGSGTGGSISTAFCPAGAIFCADFEEASGVPSNRPVGTATLVDPTEAAATFDGANGVMALDTTAPYDGRQSLMVIPASAAAVRALAVAVPSTFWVRLYIKSDQPIGQTNENGFFGAGTSATYATGNYVELSENLGCLFLDKGGTLFPTADKSCGANAALSANAWHCLVAAFDGGTGDVMVFSGPTEIINAGAWAPAREAFNTFELGTFVDTPNGATVWYDDVVISAMPLTCP